ncbi:STAS domain-containing protein [Thermobispora bispora]|uniref:Anti-sigma-factor antagonist n=1 Tax=Thermobispora bispora (strain ATCC 19993 / DSM 43833 / CBS 139.67 / JCM 10125 / KCTC 9307 / NBRC 14880 / R51) TaxID=469371 RepID=D6Y4E8_THEBD|nr:STAS domain-containing protein [Thermobispora bispora]ADG87202.1 anti-sigma-factor antagonist [Thermobispora bispora DSM 43833]
MTVQAEAAIRRTKELFLEQDGRLLDQWSEKANISADELRELYRALRTALSGKEEDFTDVRGLLAEFSRTRVRQGYTPSETARTVFALKDAMYEIVEADGSPEALRGFAWFSRLVDDLGLFTFETFSNAREKIILDQTEQLLELSTPVVKLWEGIVAVPLVGTLDSARTQVVMEKLLQTLMETGSQHAVIDITGVPAVDTQVAHHLLKTVMAARLMGAECVISGIRPQIAHTIVTLGIEFGDIVTKASLADALAHALRRSGAEIKVNGRRPDEEETESSP